MQYLKGEILVHNYLFIMRVRQLLPHRFFATFSLSSRRVPLSKTILYKKKKKQKKTKKKKKKKKNEGPSSEEENEEKKFNITGKTS
jgi:UDP-2,3-diacylglucosamine pyrophosphatase LpxH